MFFWGVDSRFKDAAPFCQGVNHAHRCLTTSKMGSKGKVILLARVNKKKPALVEPERA